MARNRSLETETPIVVQDNTKVTNKEIPAKQHAPSVTIRHEPSLFNRIKNGQIPGLRPLHTTPLYYLSRDIVGKHLGLDGVTYTEDDLTEPQLNALDNHVRWVAQQRGINSNTFENDVDTITTILNAKNYYQDRFGRDYGHSFVDKNNLPNIAKQLYILYNKTANPVQQVENIIGDGTVKFFKDGYIVTDTYDFNKGSGRYSGNESLFAKIRRFAGEYGSSDEDSNEHKQKFKISRKVNHW